MPEATWNTSSTLKNIHTEQPSGENSASKSLLELTLDWQQTMLSMELHEATQTTRSTPEEDTHVGQPCGESSTSRDPILYQQPPSQTVQRMLDPSYPSTTTPASATVTQTSHEVAWENDVRNVGKKNNVSQSGRKNRNWNTGDENQVSQDSKNYEQFFILAVIVLVVGIVCWAVVEYSHKM